MLNIIRTGLLLERARKRAASSKISSDDEQSNMVFSLLIVQVAVSRDWICKAEHNEFIITCFCLQYIGQEL
jgi:hypothetical protein